jgi:protein ImuB
VAETRIAALWGPDWPLQALVRAEPDLAARAVAVDGSRSEVGGVLVAVTRKASEVGVAPGMRASQARALCPELLVRRRDPTLELSATEALRDLALAFSPRLELDAARAGWAYVDVSGLERLVGPTTAVARGLARAGEKLGLELRVGVARTKTLARLVTRALLLPEAFHGALSTDAEGWAVLPADERRERAFLARLPIAVLEPDRDVAVSLGRFGVKTVAELWEMPRQRLAARLGPGAVRLYRESLGEEQDGGLAPTPRPTELVERTLLDWAIAELEPLSFVLRGLVDRLVGRLTLLGLAAGDLRLSFGYESHGGCERVVKVGTATRDVRALLELCRVHLAEHPPEAAVSSVAVSAAPESLRPRQLSFFAPAGPAPEKLAVTLARLRALCGADRVGAPWPLDSWLSDRFAVEPFSLEAADGPSEVDAAEHPAPMCLRRYRPPVEVEVLCAGERPASISGRGRVLQCAGPFRRCSPWWEDGNGPRADEVDHFDVTTDDGRIHRLAHDLARRCWWLEGWYD